jgi:hypothetical protein
MDNEESKPSSSNKRPLAVCREQSKASSASISQTDTRTQMRTIHANPNEAEGNISFSGRAYIEKRPLSAEAMEKQTFLLFVKILFKLLKEKQGNEFTTKARRMVMECRRRNQQNDPKFSPLMETLERHLRIFVGEAIWKRAHAYLHHYLSKKHGKHLESAEMRPQPKALAAGN